MMKKRENYNSYFPHDIPVPRNKLKVTKKGIRDTEKSLDIKLPDDFVAFVQEFGPGELCGWLRIHAPSTSLNKLDLTALNSFLKDHGNDYDAPQSVIEKLRTAVAFADAPDGSLFFWLREDLARGNSAVYFAVRRPKSLPILADSFTDMIKSFLSDSNSAPFKGLTITVPPQFTPILEREQGSRVNEKALSVRLEALSKLKKVPKPSRKKDETD
jgi:hypothetical protein